MTDPRYPIGPAPTISRLTPEQRQQNIAELAALPKQLDSALAGLNDAQLDTPYRVGGWTLRQVTHHVADSHLNAYIRTKLALTEENPVIKPYDENLWARLPDATLPINLSIRLLMALHERWVALLETLEEADFARCIIHPELRDAAVREGWQKAFHADEAGQISVEQLLTTYVWHGQHHTAHILHLRNERGW